MAKRGPKVGSWRGRSMRRIKSIRGGSIGKIARAAKGVFNNPIFRQAVRDANPAAGAALDLGESFVNGLTVGNRQVNLFSAEVNGNSGSVSETEYTATHKKSRLLKSVYATGKRNTYATNCSYRLTSSIGTQGVGTMASSAAGSTLATVDKPRTTGIFTGCHVGPGAAASLRAGSLAFMAATATSGTTLYNATNHTERIFFNGCQVETEISNLGLTPISIDIYECVAKHDLAATNISLGDDITENEVYDPAAFWSQGLVNTEAISGITNLTYTKPNSTPWDSQLFNCYWKVASKVTVNLSAGDLHRHTSTYKLNKVLPAQRFYFSSLLQGITRNIMIVAQGTPVNDSINVGRIKTGPTRVSILHTITYKYMSFPDSGERTYQEDTIQAISTAQDTIVQDPLQNITIT